MQLSSRLCVLALVGALAGCSFNSGGIGGVSDGAPRDQPLAPDARRDFRRDGGPAPDGATLEDQRADRADLLAPTDDGPQPDVLAPDVLAPDMLAPDVLAPDVLAPDVLAPDVLAPDVLPPDQGFPCGTCPQGCDSSNTRCAVLIPSGLSTAQLLLIEQAIQGSCDLSPASGQSYKISTSGLPSFPGCPNAAISIKSQGTGYPSLVVIAFDTLRIGATAQLEVSGTRGLMLYARKTIVVDGAIDAHGRGQSAGPGGRTGGGGYTDGSCWFSGGRGRRGNVDNPDDSGGGGGAHGQAGAKGGNAGSAGGGAGGSIAQAPNGVTPLIGGCSGGGGASDSAAGAGGGGGGAVHLVAGESIMIAGTVNVGGGGGRGGTSGESGGGGGAGGMLLLESQVVTVVGTVAANGGGGGSGDGSNTISNGNPGQDGQASASRASGGSSVHSKSGAGGLGGAKAGVATAGSNNENGGGGGGGVGRLHLRAPIGSVSGTSSPAHSSDTALVFD
jgi:hypothetical protein